MEGERQPRTKKTIEGEISTLSRLIKHLLLLLSYFDYIAQE
jgi:hypothetical protein